MDIPAESYPAIAVLFVPALPASPMTAIIPTASTAEGLKLAAASALASSPDISSAASIALVQNYTVAAGKKNELSATLIPTTALTPAADGTLALSGAAGATTRRFIRLSGLISSFGSATASDAKTMTMTLTQTGSEPVSVSGVGLYTSQGLVVLRESPATSLSAGMTLSRSVAWTGDDVYYAYVEFTGPSLLSLFEGHITRQCVVSYNANGGTGMVASQVVAENSSTSLAVGGFTRDGYSFMGWSTNASATTAEYAAGATFTVGSVDVTLYAIWKANVTTRAVSFNANGGTGTVVDLTGEPGTSVILPPGGFTRDGFNFLGWASTALATTSEFSPGTEFIIRSTDTTLYAVWQPVIPERAVRFDANGGAGTVADLLGPAGSSVTLPSAGFTRPGYDLVGWALSSTATSYDYAPSSSFTIGADDTTLYAVWRDTTAPTLISAAFSTPYTNTNIDVSLTLSAYELGSGIKTITLTGAFASYSTPTVQVGASYEPVSVSGGTLTFTTPVPSTASITIHGINLTTGDEIKTLQVQLSDDAGNVSGSVNATITLDTLKPTLSVMLMSGTYSPSGSTLTNGATVYTLAGGQLYLSANDSGGSGIAGYSGAGWFVASNPATFQTAGASWIQVSDNAGNYETLNFTTMLDVTTPMLGAPTSGTVSSVNIIATDMESGIKLSDLEAYYSDEFSSTQDPMTITTWTPASYAGGTQITGLPSDSTTSRYRYIRIFMSDNVGNIITRYLQRFDSATYTLLP